MPWSFAHKLSITATISTNITGGGAQEAASAAAAVLGPTTVGSRGSRKGDASSSANNNEEGKEHQHHHAHSMVMSEEEEEGGFGLSQPPISFGLSPVRNGSLWTTLSFGCVRVPVGCLVVRSMMPTIWLCMPR